MSKNNLKKKITFYIIAGEPSGDLLGARLMKALEKETNGNCFFEGIGGEEMSNNSSFKSLFDITDLAIMGLAEVIPSIPLVFRRIKETLRDIENKQPDVIITIDSWGFTGRVCTKLAKAGSKIPRVHYVAPQVWAWKKGRAKTMGQKVDHLLALLPNEPQYFKKYGLSSTCVGHPVVEGGADDGDAQKFKQKHSISDNSKVLCVLPGSRHNETKRLLPVFKESVELLSKDIPDLHIVVPTVKTVSDYVKAELSGWKIPATIVMGEKQRYDAFAASNAALAASGTVALELAIAKVPHIITYMVSPITALIMKALFKMKYVNLTNIILDKPIIPEFLQEDCTPNNICKEILPLINDDAVRNKQLDEMKNLEQTLSPNKNKTPSTKAAQTILKIIGY
ncbi:MAG: lipid-A-disaccharide synthase [Alphaproteobacteria bacterium]|nr:lipid-A-disaccharide synthase [Alphaproteobacteria bacterium]